MIDQGIDGTRLKELTKNDLRSLGIYIDEDIRILCHHLKTLNC